MHIVCTRAPRTPLRLYSPCGNDFRGNAVTDIFHACPSAYLWAPSCVTTEMEEFGVLLEEYREACSAANRQQEMVGVLLRHTTRRC